MWRDNWLLYGLRIERELRTNGIKLNIFEFENRVRDKKIALDLINNEIKDRSQRWKEKIGALTGQGYYINGALVIKKYIKSFLPFRLGNEYYVLMSRSETYEEIEKEN